MHSGKILVVDDDWKMRNLVRIYIKKDGYDVTEAVSGEEALQLLTEQAFHLILLDIMVNKAGLAYNPIQTIWGVGYRFYHSGVTT